MPPGIYNHKPHSKETKKKISIANKGKRFSKATKEKLRQSHLGKKPSEATKEKLRQSRLGKKHTEVTKEKMRQSHLGKKLSETTKEKMRQVNLGKKLSEATKEKLKKANTGEKSGKWKGDNVGYEGVHAWIRKHKGKASLYKCIDCGEQAKDWSNVDHSYKRNLEDYQPRCIGCHRKYDKKYNLIIKKERK